jgi:CheY-like chemotaxis protein
MIVNGVLVLVVEDNDDDVMLIRRAFEKVAGAKRVVVTRDGSGALRYLFGRAPYEGGERFPLPHLILLDLKMPGVDGFEVLEVIKRSARTRSIPAVVLTSSSDAADIKRCYDLGANSYLIKPVAFEQLADVIAELDKYWLALNAWPAVEVGVGGRY